MNWNYRVMRHTEPNGDIWEAIHEVYYDDKGYPSSFSTEPEPVMTMIQEDGILHKDSDLRVVLSMMAAALTKPTLAKENFPSGDQPTD